MLRLNNTQHTVNETLAASSPAIPLARRTIAGYAEAAGFTGPVLDAIRTAVSEAVTNVVRHAYQERAGEVELVAGLAGNELWVLVADRGCGFQTRARDPGLGYGLALMADASKDFVISERAGGGTEVRLFFRLPDRP
jgi:anti-sigma regulatory factor (Ser/Thr protein kinase)